MKNWTKIDKKLFIYSQVAGFIIGGLGLLTGITFLIVIGCICIFGGVWGKYFR